MEIRSSIEHLLLKIITIFSLLSIAFSDDAAVMSKLARSLSPKPTGWTSSDPCKWTDIECDSGGRVKKISLESKSLSGKLPSDLNKLTNLEAIYVQRNDLSGTIPSFENLASLQEISLEFNKFTSVSPKFLSGLSNLQHFSIKENGKLESWSIPESLIDSTSLVSFQASKCSLVGTIPNIFGSFPNLQELRLSYNNLTGSLPSSLAKSGIQNLWLNNQDQGLTGRIDLIGTMTQLQQVWLHVNQFYGPIPDLSGCTSLFDLQLRGNQLTGVIPSSLTSLPKLVNVSLTDNVFQGPVPSFGNGVNANLGKENSFCKPSPGPCSTQVNILLAVAEPLGYPMVLAESWKGNDPCNNWKFVTCDAGGKVTVINLGKQNFTGKISPELAKLTSLKTLILNDNKLTGRIPDTLTSLQDLKQLDVSNNNISGKVPEFDSKVTIITGGNPFIGQDLSEEGGSSSNHSSLPPWLIALIVVINIVIIVVSVYFLIYKRRTSKNNPQKEKKKKMKKDDIAPYNMILKEPSEKTSTNSSGILFYGSGNVSISFETLKEATENFSENNILGRGGFGVVYKGKLQDGTLIAVKRMESANKGHSEFDAEIEVLTKVRHRHLVALTGFCDNGAEKLLVYEYMANGTLGQHLFHHKEIGVRPLTWKQRMAIGLDVARGIEYLHSLAQQSFIHRDLKPSNILLGEDMRGKVSDFGLVRNAPDGKYSVETRLAGTFGYLAPEYAATGRVTTKVDVFAFGVVLMEMITGRKALNDSLPEDECHLVSWFSYYCLGNHDRIRANLDPKLELLDDSETLENIYTVAELAGHCTTREPNQRPDMSHAVNVLAPLVDKWRPTARGPADNEYGIDMSLPHALEKWKAGEDSFMSDFSMDYSQTRTFQDSFGSKNRR